MTVHINQADFAFIATLGNRVSQHVLVTTHALADILAPGYFDRAASNVRQCDVIDVVANTGGVAEYARLAVTAVRTANDKPRVLVRVLTTYQPTVIEVAKFAPNVAA